MTTYQQHKQKIEENFGYSFWLRDAIAALEQRDPVDAVNDSRFLAELMQLRLRDLQQARTS